MSEIINHDWNGVKISQAAKTFALGKHQIPVGAINLTELCKQHGKDVNQFTRLLSTEEFCSVYKQKHGIFPVFTTPGRNGATWVVLALGIKSCAWFSTEFELWGMETLTKVVTGQDITDADRAEGWARATEIGVEAPQVQTPSSTLPDAWAETASLLRLSAEFSMEPAAVLKVHQQLHGLIATPEPKSSPVVEDLKPRPVDVEAVQRFCEECGFVIAPDRSHFVQVRDVWTAYELWYEASGTTLFSKPQDVFRVISTVFPKVTHSRHSGSRRAIIRGLQKAKSDVYKPSWVSKVGETLEQLASMGMALTAANVINSLGIPHDRSSEMHVAAEAKLLGYRNKRVRSGEQNSRTWFRAE